MLNLTSARKHMIQSQLRANNITNSDVLKLFDLLPRDFFVPSLFTKQAYADMPIPLEFNQHMLTPLEEAKIIQALNVQKTDCVLEIGTGSGYFTGLLAKLSAQVESVDIFPEFSLHAKNKLSLLGIDNVRCLSGDAAKEWQDIERFNKIVITGSLVLEPKQYLSRLCDNGTLFAIVGSGDTMQARLYEKISQNVVSVRNLFEMNTPTLLNAPKPNLFDF